jgi:hypothetical protein
MDLGIALLRAGHGAEAIEQLNAAAAQDAGAEAHRYLAEAYASLNQPENSRQEHAIYERMRREAIRRAGAGR